MGFKTSENGMKFLMSQEGYRLTAYRLKNEKYYTIGYGHYGPDVKPGQTITKQQAIKMFQSDLSKEYEGYVNKLLTDNRFKNMNQNQFDALVSYVYNRGPGGLNQLVNNSKSLTNMGNNLPIYWGSAKTYRDALIKRRYREQKLFFKPIEPWLVKNIPAPGNKFYNNNNDDDSSNCSIGSPMVKGYNVLCNCVGLAWGAFYETWYKNDVTSYNAVGRFESRVKANAGAIIDACSSSSVFSDYIRDASDTPPKGGLIVWSSTARLGHVAYISNVSEDGNTITIHQSSYTGADWPNSYINGIQGAWHTTNISRNNKGTNLWWYQNTVYSGSKCEGFLANPGVINATGNSGGSDDDDDETPATLSKYGSYVEKKFHTNQIYTGSKWQSVTPMVWNGSKWIKCLK